MRFRTLFFSLISLAASMSCLASAWSTVAVTITGYYVFSTGGAYITTSGNQNPDNCTNPLYLYLDTTTPNFKELYATVMAARASGETVSLFYDGCVGLYPRVSVVAVPHVW